eukprot:11220032-Lingulodinium_polyedra.AAC.1
MPGGPSLVPRVVFGHQPGHSFPGVLVAGWPVSPPWTPRGYAEGLLFVGSRAFGARGARQLRPLYSSALVRAEE